jgi:hypothetical protein
MIRRHGGRTERGQILPLFALSLVVMLSFAALLFDGANSLVQRRRLQNAGDAAALAGSNMIQLAGSIRSCSASDGPPPGAPRADISAAALASIAANLPGFATANVTVTCAEGWQNKAVRVNLQVPPTNWFGGAIGFGGSSVGTASVALNGQIAGSVYSVVVLDPANPTWSSGRRGCPAFLISGGPQITFDGSVMIDSACPSSSGGALGTNGSSASVGLSSGNNPTIRMVGSYSPGPLVISPTPMTGQPYVKDPFLGLDPPTATGLTVQKTARHVVNGTTETLSPGVYRGGIELRSSAKVFLRPGIYFIDGGDFSVGAQAELCSITATATPANCTAGWAADCPDTQCGVLIYKNVKTTDSVSQDRINVGAGAVLKLRAYDERANGNAYAEYRNLLIWQSATPVPSSTYEQPWIQLGGGGSADISGTVYAPSAKVLMGGGGSGSGGSATNLTLQFITWNLEISGNATFHFFYNDAEFARPTDYGLVQ